ncbi:murein biosynthesis integral membrane protein MurJ [uncultured Microbacterium sp.]|uniref:murein biosynthesis integral membrane protein MurJ n=1 Tax=uncultured Microbacterium sp. TaxID=191216 RepID=UPI0026208040|nr:murein biosynthesis integral membrane protein MurJ [uncultured Microbacterium sp.]
MGLGRASALIAAGTLTSRITGLLRATVLVAAVGSIGQATDAFATANQLPNAIYQVISAGLLTGVIVPQVVRASAQKDGGHAFLAKLLTMGMILVGGVTVVAVFAAPALVSLYAPHYQGAQYTLAVAFAYWCIPQLFFYGMFALLGEILNARRVFGPYAWAPISNNIVSIVGFLAFMMMFGGDRRIASEWTPEMIALFAGTATLGIVAQTIVLLFFWRRVGIPLRLDFHWRGMGLGTLGRLATWTLMTTLLGQLVGIVQSSVVTAASGDHPSVQASGLAWLVYMVPYSVIILAIGTPYFTRLSEHASAERHDHVRDDIGQSIRVLGVLVMAGTAAVAAASVAATRVFSSSAADAVITAPVLLAYLVSLIPMAVLFIVQRTFYAYGDARTPFVFTIVQAVLVLTGTIVVSFTTPLAWMAAVVALVQSCAGILQTVLATILLRRKLGPLGLMPTWLALLRFAVAAIPAGLAGYGVYLLSGGAQGWMLNSQLMGAVGSCVIGAVVAVVYAALLAVLRVPELRIALDAVRRRG